MLTVTIVIVIAHNGTSIEFHFIYFNTLVVYYSILKK